MKKNILLFVFILILIGSGIFIYFISNNNNSSKSIYNTSKVDNSKISKPITYTEVEMTTYSTVIKNKKDSNRQQNISISCNTLNESEVKPGETFSFCNTVGEATADRGYKKANIIVKGVEIKGLGGRKLSNQFNSIQCRFSLSRIRSSRKTST